MRLNPHVDGGGRSGHVHSFPARDFGLNPNRISVPGLHRYLAVLRMNFEPLPSADSNRRIELLDTGQGQSTESEGEQHVEFLSADRHEGGGLAKQF
jgi:hypothetical protein